MVHTAMPAGQSLGLLLHHQTLPQPLHQPPQRLPVLVPHAALAGIQGGHGGWVGRQRVEVQAFQVGQCVGQPLDRRVRQHNGIAREPQLLQAARLVRQGSTNHKSDFMLRHRQA